MNTELSTSHVAATVEIPEPAPRFSYSEDRFFLAVAIFTGVISGLAVVCFRMAIEYCKIKLLGSALLASGPRMLLAPALTGLVVAVLVLWVFPSVRGSGINQTKAGVYIYDGYIPFRTAIGKFITCSLAIGSGQSLGPEDPSLQIGAAIASMLGRRLNLPREKRRLMAPIGAAAGLAAAFNAPISAILFVIEEVLGRWSAGILGAVVLSTISSVVVSRWFFGSQPLFRIPPVELRRPVEMIAYLVLGVAGGIASLIFSMSVGYLRPKMKGLPRWTQIVQPALAGLMIGAIGYFGFPQVMGAGYEFIDQALHSQFTWNALAALAILKILATTISFVSGTPGGMFAPTLFVGAMLGGAVGSLEHMWFPNITGAVGTYVLVGMGVLFAGFLRAPLTSVFMVLEVSGNYSIIVPVIVANTIAYLIARKFQPTPVFETLTRQDGLELPSMEEQREESILRVEDAMTSPVLPVFSGEDLLSSVLDRFASTGNEFALVRTSSNLWAIIKADDIPELLGHFQVDVSLDQILSDAVVPHLYPDHPMEAAVKYLQKWPVLPVVHRADTGQLVGVVYLCNVLSAYARAAERAE